MIGHLLGAAGGVEAIATVQVNLILNTYIHVYIYKCVQFFSRCPNIVKIELYSL